jgi:CheY-like chemotaxis protein
MSIACIIDDDPIQALLLERMLYKKKLCKRLYIFKNGLEALEHLKTIHLDPALLPDVILLDINMPVMDGWGFLEEFRNMKPRLGKKILLYMISSSIWQEDIDRAKSYSEVTDYIVKPVTMDELSNLMGRTGYAMAEE